MVDEDYRILDLEVGASSDEIQTAYYDLVEVWHPDKFAHNPRLQAKAEAKMKRIHQAYERLCGLRPAEQEPQPGVAHLPEQRAAKPEGTKSHPKNLFPTRPASTWVGERFIFLPQPTQFQKYGYRHVFKDSERWGDHLPYGSYTGRIARVTKVRPSDLNPGDWDIDLVLEESGETVYATTLSGEVESLALVADIDAARSQYLGKTLWTEETVATYSESTEEQSLLDTPVGYFPVKVLNVVPGWFSTQPVRFILQVPSGKKGFIDVYMSETNIASPLEFQSFRKVFSTEYPTDGS